MTPAKLQAELLRYDSIPVLNKRDIQRLLGLSPKATDRAIRDAIDEKILVRIKAGLYSLAVKPPHTFVVANHLMDPSYISLESALSMYRIIPETVYSVTSITPKYPKKFVRLNRDFTYHKMNRKLYFGYQKVSVGGASVIVAEKEKAVLDYLYFIVRGLRRINSRADFSRLNQTKLTTYADIFRSVLKGRKRIAFGNLLRDTLDI